MPEFIGTQHNKLLAQLRDEWVQSGRPVCVIEGFPGVGKTELAERLIDQTQRKFVYVECPENDIDATSDLLAHLAEELAKLDYPEMADAGQDIKKQVEALHKTLSAPLLIVIDEFQNALVGSTGKPKEHFAASLEAASRDHHIQGRLLLLTNRAIERSRWSERFEVNSFPEFTPAEGEQFLASLLAKWGRLDDIPVSRRAEVVEGLGRNPRALTTLIHCLSDEPLDDLFGESRDAWEVDDRRVSPQLVAKIEEGILKRSLRLLEHESLVFLRRLCVHRMSLRKETLEHMAMPGTDFLRSVSDLTQRFMLNQRRGYYHIHALVHAIAKERWAAESREMVNAHSVAADFYARPFKAKRLIVSGRTGGQFAELRYHLTKSGRSSDLGEFHERIVGELVQYWHGNSPVPKDASERDDRITLLSSVLVARGPDGLETYLTRLLCARGRAEDADRACVHAKRVSRQAHLYESCGELLAKVGRIGEAVDLLRDAVVKLPSNRSLYQSYGEMIARAGRDEEAIGVLKHGIDTLPPSQSLYQCYGELLAKAGRNDEAIGVLKQGIAKVPPHQNAFALYDRCSSLLAGAGRIDEAIDLLSEGLEKVPSHTGLSALYEICGDMFARFPPYRSRVVALLTDGISRVPYALGGRSIAEALLRHFYAIGDMASLNDIQASLGEPYARDELRILAHVLALQAQNKWEQAGEHGSAGCRKYPDYLPLMQQSAFSWLCARRQERAGEAVNLFTGQVGDSEQNVVVWIRAFIAHVSGDQATATAYLSSYLGRPLNEDEKQESIGTMLVGLWSRQKNRVGHNLPYFFPVLPPSLTGMDRPLHRFASELEPPAAVGDAGVQAHGIGAPRESLEEKVRSSLSNAYFDNRLNDSDYQESFRDVGRDKAQSVLQKFSEVPAGRQASYAYVSIGGADGSEIAWAMSHSPIRKGILLEYGTDAAAAARARVGPLTDQGKSLVVLEGDAVQKLGELLQKLNVWKQQGDIDGIVVSAQSVLHELPYRSPRFDPNVFLGQLFKGWHNVLFCCREPCRPQGWPDIVQLKLKGVSGDTLAAMARHIKAKLDFAGDVYSVANEFVQMSSDLALETLFKVLYLDDTFSYEMEERLTAFDPEQVSRILERYLGPNTVHIEYTVSGHFKQEYQRVVDLVIDAETQSPLRMPNSFARITAGRWIP